MRDGWEDASETERERGEIDLETMTSEHKKVGK